MFNHVIEAKLDLIIRLLGLVIRKENTAMADLTALTAQVQANTTVVGSALTLIQGLAQQLADAGTDPVKLQALQDQLKASDDALAQAVAANTPAPPSSPPAAPAA